MQPNQFDLIAQQLTQPIDALGLLTRALRHRTRDRDAEVILDDVELGLEQVRRQLSSVLDLARAEHCLALFEPRQFRILDVLEKLTLQTDRVAYDMGARLSVVPTSAVVLSDIRALEIILRSVVVAALHLAVGGRVLIGARPRGSETQVQVWAKPGAPQSATRAARLVPQDEPVRQAPALVLEIASTLAQGLGHEFNLRSSAEGGAVFSIALPTAPGAERQVSSLSRAAEECA